MSNNNGLVGTGATLLPSIAVNTDANGKAQVNWTLGGRAGSGSNGVEATSMGYDGTAIFIATGTQGGPRNIVIDTGDAQTGAVDTPLPRPLIAVVVDSGNNRLANVPVTFTVTAGDGKFGAQSSYTVNSDSDGRVAATLTLGPNGGTANNVVQATFPGNPAAPAIFTASGKVPGNPADTTITGVVLDNSNLPIQGVTVRAVLSNLLTSNGQIVNTLPSVQTNAQGQFTVVNAPVGYVKLLVDGSTAMRPNVTFPTLDYDLVTVAGQVNTVGLPIYLPALSNNRLCVTETTGGGTLTMVDAPGFALTFSPGQVTFPGGSKSGCVSATLVNSDKMPMVPGFGQQPRFLVTIQPAGALFNPPAQISMPNVDGLPPHAVTEMYSFDHDIGAFVAIGTGTVSADGLSITSSPGSGVLKAGWHCGGNPAAAGGAQTVHVTIGTPGPIQLDINATGSASSTGTPSPGDLQLVEQQSRGGGHRGRERRRIGEFQGVDGGDGGDDSYLHLRIGGVGLEVDYSESGAVDFDHFHDSHAIVPSGYGRDNQLPDRDRTEAAMTRWRWRSRTPQARWCLSRPAWRHREATTALPGRQSSGTRAPTRAPSPIPRTGRTRSRSSAPRTGRTIPIRVRRASS